MRAFGCQIINRRTNMFSIKRSNKPQIALLLFLIILITFFSFYPSLKNSFVNWDDDSYVIQNPLIRELSWKGIKQIFTPSTYTMLNPAQLYVPLAILSYAFEYRFFKLDPFIYHITNLSLHLLNCLLVFWFIFLLSDEIIIAFMVAILFGVHPLHVESVVWITERKDVLYAFFFLSALICHIYYLKNKEAKLYYLVLALFILALLSKPVAVVLPIALLLCDYFLNGRITAEDLLKKIPLFCIVAAFIVVGKLTSKSYMRIDPKLTFLDHLLITNYALIFYLKKLIMPVRLSCLYPYPLKNTGLLPFAFLLSPLIVTVLISMVIFSRKYTKKIIFGSAFFLITIFLYLQLFPTGPTIVSDRYTYIPSIGIFFILAELMVVFYRKKMPRSRIFNALSIAIFTVAICALSTLTWNQCKVWKDSLALWDNAINKYPDAYIPLAYFKRGVVYSSRQENEKAALDFNKAVMIYYRQLGINQNFTGVYNELLKLDYGYSALFDFLAVKFAQINRIHEAVILFNIAIKANPSNVQAYSNLCSAYGNLARYKEAIAAGEKAVEINQHSAQGHYNLSVAYFFDGQYAPALEHLNTAIKLGFKPGPEFVEKFKRPQAGRLQEE
jgi:tetratricopeptide (TPR) repeat protein